jgi:hypothetical protein
LEALPDFTAPFADAKSNQEQILYRKDRFQMLDGKQESFVGTTNSYNSYSVLKLKENTLGRAFVVATTHLDAFDPDQTIRPNQMHKICDQVEKLLTADGHEPVMIIGDFNDIYSPLRVRFLFILFLMLVQGSSNYLDMRFCLVPPFPKFRVHFGYPKSQQAIRMRPGCCVQMLLFFPRSTKVRRHTADFRSSLGEIFRCHFARGLATRARHMSGCRTMSKRKESPLQARSEFQNLLSVFKNAPHSPH